MPEPTKERKKIKVDSVGTPRKIGNYEVLEFKGEDNVKYEAWEKSLAAEIKQGVEIDADIVHSQKETESGIFFHHKITQLYKDGQPVSQPSQSRGRGYAQDSPEKIMSIQGQTAYNGLIELIKADKIGVDSEAGKLAIDWAVQSLEALLKRGKIITEETKKPVAKAAPPKESETAPSKGEATQETKAITVEELFHWIADNMKWKTATAARTWIINKVKITGERIDAEPDKVKSEIMVLMDWTA